MRSSNIDSLVKISLIGQPAVGKTTILKLLSEKTIDKIYLPTQGFDLKTVKFGKYYLKVWDFGGQKAYLKMYLKDYLRGSDVVFVVTDSSPRNVLNSREIIDYAATIVEHDCPIIAIANKQDLCESDGRMDADRVSNVLRVKTIGLTAIKRSERRRLMGTIKNELNQVFVRRRLKEVEI
jgi:small GTP-binding protein